MMWWKIHLRSSNFHSTGNSGSKLPNKKGKISFSALKYLERKADNVSSELVNRRVGGALLWGSTKFVPDRKVKSQTRKHGL